MFNENPEQWIKLFGSRQSFTYECTFCSNVEIKYNPIWELELGNNTFDLIDWIMSPYDYGSIQALLNLKYGGNEINNNSKSGTCSFCYQKCIKLATFDFAPIIFIRDDVRRNKHLSCDSNIILNGNDYKLFGRILNTNEYNPNSIIQKGNHFYCRYKKNKYTYQADSLYPDKVENIGEYPEGLDGYVPMTYCVLYIRNF
jgi:hypothetical protein